jgi:hypothetical protein
MAPPLSIFDAAVVGFGCAMRSLPRLLTIFWLPWLLGTAALLILDVVVEDQLRLGPAPAWARSIVWAPFAAVAYLMLLRWALGGPPPARAVNLDVGREARLATPIVAAWLVANDIVSASPVPLLIRLVPRSGLFADGWDDLAVYLYGFKFAAWVVKVALLPCVFGLLVVIARYGWPDPRVFWRLLRIDPLRLFCIAILATAADGGMWILGSSALGWLHLDDLRPNLLIPWRAHIGRAFVAELAYFPLHLLDFAIEGCMLAEAYRRLLLGAPDEERKVAMAGP